MVFVIVQKTLGLIKFTSASSEKKKQKRQELVEILLHYLLAYQLLSLKVVYAALLSQVFQHVTERIKKLTIFRVLIKVLKKSIYVYFLLS